MVSSTNSSDLDITSFFKISQNILRTSLGYPYRFCNIAHSRVRVSIEMYQEMAVVGEKSPFPVDSQRLCHELIIHVF